MKLTEHAFWKMPERKKSLSIQTKMSVQKKLLLHETRKKTLQAQAELANSKADLHGQTQRTLEAQSQAASLKVEVDSLREALAEKAAEASKRAERFAGAEKEALEIEKRLEREAERRPTSDPTAPLAWSCCRCPAGVVLLSLSCWRGPGFGRWLLIRPRVAAR